MQSLVFSDEEIPPDFVKEVENSSSLRLACMPAFASGKGANCRRRQGYIFVVAGSLARGWEKPGDVQKMGYRKSLTLRFYGSSSSIMRRKSTIKPLLRREELPVLNHCVQRALKTRSLTETLGEMAKNKIDSFMINKRATLKLGSLRKKRIRRECTHVLSDVSVSLSQSFSDDLKDRSERKKYQCERYQFDLKVTFL